MLSVPCNGTQTPCALWRSAMGGRDSVLQYSSDVSFHFLLRAPRARSFAIITIRVLAMSVHDASV